MAITDSKLPANPGHVLVDNEILVQEVEQMLESSLDVRMLMTIDNDLVGVPGDIRKLRTYQWEGVSGQPTTIQQLEMGQGNDITGKVTYTEETKEIELYQSVFTVYDEEVRRDPMVLTVGLKGIKTDFIKHVQNRFYAALDDATNEVELAAPGDPFTYDDVVDALDMLSGVSELGENSLEDGEVGVFILAGKEFKKDIRKDEAFKAAEQGKMLFTGNFGSVSGLPIIYSNKVKANECYVMTKKAIRFLNKKNIESEIERTANLRRTDYYMRFVNLIYLEDQTQIIRIVKPE